MNVADIARFWGENTNYYYLNMVRVSGKVLGYYIPELPRGKVHPSVTCILELEMQFIECLREDVFGYSRRYIAPSGSVLVPVISSDVPKVGEFACYEGTLFREGILSNSRGAGSEQKYGQAKKVQYVDYGYDATLVPSVLPWSGLISRKDLSKMESRPSLTNIEANVDGTLTVGHVEGVFTKVVEYKDFKFEEVIKTLKRFPSYNKIALERASGLVLRDLTSGINFIPNSNIQVNKLLGRIGFSDTMSPTFFLLKLLGYSNPNESLALEPVLNYYKGLLSFSDCMVALELLGSFVEGESHLETFYELVDYAMLRGAGSSSFASGCTLSSRFYSLGVPKTYQDNLAGRGIYCPAGLFSFLNTHVKFIPLVKDGSFIFTRYGISITEQYLDSLISFGMGKNLLTKTTKGYMFCEFAELKQRAINVLAKRVTAPVEFDGEPYRDLLKVLSKEEPNFPEVNRYAFLVSNCKTGFIRGSSWGFPDVVCKMVSDLHKGKSTVVSANDDVLWSELVGEGSENDDLFVNDVHNLPLWKLIVQLSQLEGYKGNIYFLGGEFEWGSFIPRYELSTPYKVGYSHHTLENVKSTKEVSIKVLNVGTSSLYVLVNSLLQKYKERGVDVTKDVVLVAPSAYRTEKLETLECRVISSSQVSDCGAKYILAVCPQGYIPPTLAWAGRQVRAFGLITEQNIKKYSVGSFRYRYD